MIVEASICDAPWAGTWQTIVFFLTLVKSLGHKCSSTESLGHESPRTVDEPTTFCKETIFECDSKMTEEDYKQNINSLVAALTMDLNE